MKQWIVNMMLLVAMVSPQSVVWASDSPAHTLALVTTSDLAIKKLPPNALRKLFLGLPLVVDGITLIPLRNYSDDLVKETFLQKVMYMSERHYERQLLSQAFRTGNSRPPIYTDYKELIQALKNEPRSISVIWLKDANKDSALRILQTFKGRAH